LEQPHLLRRHVQLPAVAFDGYGMRQQRLLPPVAAALFRQQAAARARRHQADQVRAVAGLRDQGQVVAPEQPAQQAPEAAPAQPRGDFDDLRDRRVAAQHAGGAREGQHVDARLRPALPGRVQQGRGQQHVADLARGHDQDAFESVRLHASLPRCSECRRA
jgi:hypothetical protein